MSSSVLAFWRLLEGDANLHEQALLANEMNSLQSSAAYLAGLAGGRGLNFTAEEYLRSAQGYTMMARTPLGPIRLAPGPGMPLRAFSNYFYLPDWPQPREPLGVKELASHGRRL